MLLRELFVNYLLLLLLLYSISTGYYYYNKYIYSFFNIGIEIIKWRERVNKLFLLLIV